MREDDLTPSSISAQPTASSAPAQIAGSPAPDEPRREETMKESIISIVMSFAMVFIFTRFVAASYVIPTGSMAPTLHGAHMRFYSQETGETWAVNPWHYNGQRPYKVQGPSTVRGAVVAVEDPFIGGRLPRRDVPLRIGDRIFVHKYLYGVTDPKRWDVVVFRFPGNARENYIKRLVGLPDEDIWLVDGDVFTRSTAGANAGDGAASNPWRIQRKPDRVQRAVWYTLYSSEFRSLHEKIEGRTWRDRWITEGWSAQGLAYRHDSAEPATIRWNNAVRPIDDWVSYNDVPRFVGALKRYPVSDLRLRAGVKPDSEGLRIEATLEARSHFFQAVIEGDQATLRMSPRSEQAGQRVWTTLATASVKPLTPGRVTDVELWHVDQALELWIDGKKIAQSTYEWDPYERLSNVFGHHVPRDAMIEVASERLYQKPVVRWSFEGSPVTLYRVGLDRDLYYQPSIASRGGGAPARGADPQRPMALGHDEFFMLGDNSPASGDSRAWEKVDPWVERAFHIRKGVVPRELLMGKAFCVFWPSPHRNLGSIPVPDFGRMRLIR